MVREISITLYLIIFKLVFNFFKLMSLKNKVTFVITFGDNSKYVYEEVRKKKAFEEVVVLYKGSSYLYFEEYEDVKLIPFETKNIMSMLKSIYHLATSKYVLVDNYFGFLASIKFKQKVECIQLWHASGAIKKFGLEDQSVEMRSSKAKERFNQVYKKFNKVIVGSDVMADTFMRSFSLKNMNILRTGIPRTDFFYDEQLHEKIKAKLINENLFIKDKKRILYAPTYRDHQLDHFEIELDLEKMAEELGDRYVVILRLHPAIKNTLNYSKLFPGFVFDYSSSEYDINELLLLSDILITDYSSLPYEFSLLNKPMIFFAYDLEEYKIERGILDNYEKVVPGPVVTQTNDVINIIKKDHFNLEQVAKYAREWNKYSTGKASENLVKYMLSEESNQGYQKERLKG